MVIAMTTGGVDVSDILGPIPFDLVTDRLIAAAVSDGPRPANTEAAKVLQERVAELAHPAPAPIAPLPAMAAAISGQIYDLTERPIDLYFAFYGEDFFADTHEGFRDPGSYNVKAVSLAFPGREARLTLAFDDGYQAELAVGLDGVYRVTETRLGPLAARGAWYGEDEFRLQLAAVGNSHLFRFAFLFGDAPIQIVAQELWEHKVATWVAWPRQVEP
jgi:hypothetical protein